MASKLLVACAVAALSAGAANAATLFNFSYSYGTVSASGIFTGTDQGNGSFLITAVTGSRFAASVETLITGLAPVGTGGYTDNLLFPALAVPVDFPGITYVLAGGTNINLYRSNAYGNVREYVNFANEVPSNGSFALTVSQVSSDVPEPATWAMFIGGFGLVGGALRRRKIVVNFA